MNKINNIRLTDYANLLANKDTVSLSEYMGTYKSRITQESEILIPLHQFFEQGKILTNVRSLTSRFFTCKKITQNHCQLGNSDFLWKSL